MIYQTRIPNWMKLSLKPDLVIGLNYLRRWWILPRNPWFNIYLHQINEDDDGRALHDHPWNNCSIILKGAYVEIMPLRQVTEGSCEPCLHISRLLTRGNIVFRKATFAHRLEVSEGPVWSLFLTTRVRRRWGFHLPNYWVWHREMEMHEKNADISNHIPNVYPMNPSNQENS